MRELKRFLLLVSIYFVFVLPCFAPPEEGDPACFPPSSCIPIDGGIGILIAAGAAYGASKLFGPFRQKK